MKNVTDAFKAAQASPSSISIRRVSYKRRYWQQSTQSYIWETNWTTLSESDVVSVSAITAKLDTEAVNEFKVSNLTVTLKNADRRWTPTNPFGRFGKDAASPLNGYEPFWTKFRIETGYVVNGVDTFVPLFVGVAVDFQTAGHSDTMQVSVQGLEALLQNANAENVSTLVENETPTGTVNGTNKDFVTLQPGVGIIKKVTVNNVEKFAGTHYTISNLDVPTLGAKVTFVTAPTTGQIVNVSYSYWFQDILIHTLVTELVKEIGIPESDITTEAVTFQGTVTQALNFNSYATFSAGTVSGASLTRVTDKVVIDMDDSSNNEILDDFADGDYTASPTWTTGGYMNGWSIDSGRLKWNSVSTPGLGYIDTSSSHVIGEWNFDIEYKNDSGAGSGRNVIDLAFIATSSYFTYSGSNYTHRGYRVSFETSNDGSTTTMFLYLDSETAATSASVGSLNGVHTVKIIRLSDGKISVYFDGTLKINSYASSSITGSKIGISCYMYYLGQPTVVPVNMKFYIDNIINPKSGLVGVWESQTLDLSADVVGFNAMANSLTHGSGDVSVETKSSVDGISWSSWQYLATGSVIQSPANRYLKIKTTLYKSSLSQGTEPSVNSLKLNYITSSVPIKLAKLTDKTVYAAIQSLGSFSNYEWGFDEQEKFFFRSKNVDKEIDEELSSSKNVIEISSLDQGYDKIYSEVQAEYGTFNEIARASESNKDSIAERFGIRRFSVSGADILLDEDTNIASGIAKGLVDYYSKPRRTCKAKTKLMEWVDLSDTVSVTYRDQPNNWWMGDTQVYLGQTDIYLHGPEANTLDGFLAKVVGYRHDTESKISEFDLEEIIQ